MSEVRKHIVSKLPMLRGRAVNLLRSSQGADDLVQQTVMAALRFENHFQAGSNLDAWLLTILRNNFLNSKRRESMEGKLMLWGDSADVAVETDPDGRLMLEAAADAISQLSVGLRDTLLDLTINDKGLPIGTVKSRVNRAREQILEAVGEY
jgi:DNA-directed RNA polymerase specialized sigma24 family protein